MTVTVTLRERGSNAFLELRSLFIGVTLHVAERGIRRALMRSLGCVDDDDLRVRLKERMDEATAWD